LVRSSTNGSWELVRRIDEARESGARELVGGTPQGWVIRATDDEHALHLANDTPYGLASAVFAGDLERGVRFAQRSKRA
jgi:aldehyde dehydrogenase (NAD+)